MRLRTLSLVAGLSLLVLSCDNTATTVIGTSIAGGGSDQLVFTEEPTSATMNAVFAVQVTVQTSSGTLDTTFTNAITVAVGSNPGGGQLTGTTSVLPSGGVASFTNLAINEPGSGYTLTASATNANSATSSSFTVAQ